MCSSDLALWFARTDLETDDFWFNGFPAAWNLAVPTFFLANMTPTQVAFASVILCASQLSTFKLPHIVRATQWRNVTLPFGTLYVVNLAYLSWVYTPNLQLNWLTGGILVTFPVYAAGLGAWRTWFYRESAA